jgi:hypothetical protein
VAIFSTVALSLCYNTIIAPIKAFVNTFFEKNRKFWEKIFFENFLKKGLTNW